MRWRVSKACSILLLAPGRRYLHGHASPAWVGKAKEMFMTHVYEAPRRLIPAAQWNQHHVWPTVSALRYYIFHARRFGLERAIVRMGRRVLVDDHMLFRLLEARGGNDAAR